MSNFVWSETLCSGEPLLDAEHREIVEWLSLVAAASHGDSPHPGAFHAIGYLRRFWREHIRLEEHYMAVLRYPEESADAHRSAHQVFTERLARTAEWLQDPEEDRDLHKVVAEMTAWLEEHITLHDRALIAFVRTQGEQEGADLGAREITRP